MSETADWDSWLANEDSVDVLAPEGYDDHAALERLKALWRRLTSDLATYEVRRPEPNWYQDSTAMADYRVTAKGDSKPFAAALAWILLSHFGDLATVKDCHDPALLAKIRGALEDFGLRYIPYDYVRHTTAGAERCSVSAGQIDIFHTSWT